MRLIRFPIKARNYFPPSGDPVCRQPDYRSASSSITYSAVARLLHPLQKRRFEFRRHGLGSSGLLLIPNTNYALGGGRQGVLYLVDTAAMGEFSASSDNVRQQFQAVYGVGTSQIHGGAVYFNSDVDGPTTYVWGENDVLRGFRELLHRLPLTGCSDAHAEEVLLHRPDGSKIWLSLSSAPICLEKGNSARWRSRRSRHLHGQTRM
jgi:hypothetical protein